jgi:hypothetical protein
MNWGKKLIMALIAFMSFIAFLSARMIMSNNDDLITKDYYEDGLNYDQEYNARRQAIKDSIIPDFVLNDEALLVSFPCKVSYKLKTKCLANSSKDNHYEGTTTSTRTILIPKNELDIGEWQLQLQYAVAEKKYFIKKSILVP